MVKDFEPSLYKYEYQVKLREIIEQKIAGKDIKASAPEVQVNAIDIKVTDLTLTERKALLQKAIKSEDGRN
jgi:non-homologous end joining protein Ku